MRNPGHATRGSYAPPSPAGTLTAESADGGRLHVEVFGPSGAPAVVLSHGWTCSTAFWAAQVRALAPDHRVITYDQRGHGRSPAPAQLDGYTTDVLADDLEAVLAATLEPGEKAVLVGHSMGGMTFMAASGRAGFKEHAGAVLLCSTGSSGLVAGSEVLPMRAGPLRTRLTAAVLGARAPLGPVTPAGKRVLKYGVMGPGSTPEQVDACARIVHACPTPVRYGWSRVLERLALDEGVTTITAPTAVIVGTADRLTPVAHARAIAGALPHCVGLTELPGLGHMTPIEAPAAVTARIRDLVTTHVLPLQVKETS
ncbi:alpha/beta fold hydrolase [Streptomyces tsukubensis]|uniref:Alpha/beta hydrolase n=1 Tax=Streptomyces tsukubensis TaxID=83656 RepID=A0A1V4A5U2_9ACTN|nr:alpha/beta hydrolase [Streptomyces tsukubensis]OON75985.1 alpha/beta hydrolase [Streptomyces tsukubensis]QFR94075.1 alpha/beta fold hydrolase [Streptomyces tsukubensis]